MIRIFVPNHKGFHETALETNQTFPKETVWIDLFEPSSEEKKVVESFYSISIPTFEEMQEIEASSRLYEQNNAVYLTANLIIKTDTPDPQLVAITFIITGQTLVTIRYKDSYPFTIFSIHPERMKVAQPKGSIVCITFLEYIVDRLADILEKIMRNVDLLSHEIFYGSDFSTPDLQKLLRQIGENGNLVSKSRESLVSISRLIGFFAHFTKQDFAKNVRNPLDTLMRDTNSLSDHATFLSNKVNFLLDATLGMINIEQNNIIKIFSVAAVVLLPPTLIASIYGMNFHMMPELEFAWGYPIALILMFLSAFLPFMYFKKKHWL